MLVSGVTGAVTAGRNRLCAALRNGCGRRRQHLATGAGMVLDYCRLASGSNCQLLASIFHLCAYEYGGTARVRRFRVASRTSIQMMRTDIQENVCK